MNNVIPGNFKKKYTIVESKVFLEEFYDQAMNVWDLDELRRTANHPECFFTDAHEAYSAILRHRESLINAPCPVVDLAEYRKNKIIKLVPEQVDAEKDPIRYVCEMTLEESQTLLANG